MTMQASLSRNISARLPMTIKKASIASDGRKRECNKVIIVTHSMGGLVARSACVLHGAEGKVLGVIHGVQPSVGSPAAYWRMKAGFERPRGGPNSKRTG